MELIICGALVIGLVISILEFIFVHSDEPGGIGFQHAFGTFIPTMIMTFASVNAGLVLSLFKISESMTWDLIVRGAVALIAIIWINAKAMIGRGVGEKIPHSIVIAALIFAAYYIWTFALGKLIGGILPC